jgi:hypothetical protein
MLLSKEGIYVIAAVILGDVFPFLQNDALRRRYGIKRAETVTTFLYCLANV